jgi:5,10-methylene-tetrahydrofolate dehydrogenase/methenyl tetrahydrofolate cyclohydrolase
MATIIDGKAIAQSIRDGIATEVKSLSSNHNLVRSLYLFFSPMALLNKS